MNISNKIIVFGRSAIVFSTIRCLQVPNLEVYAIVIGEKKGLVRWSRYVKQVYLVHNDKEGLEFIYGKFRRETTKPILISCNDSVAELVDSMADKLREYFIISSCEDEVGRLAYWMNKDAMCELAEKIGFNVPKYWTLDLENLLIDWEQFVYPCITKALKSSVGRKDATRICYTREELIQAVENASHFTRYLLVQQFVKFDKGYCTLGVRLNNTKKVIIGCTGNRFRSNLQMYGYPTFSRLERSLPPSVSEKMIAEFVERTGYTGLFSFETIVADGITYFIEINFRTDGKIFGMPATGCNIVMDWIADASGLPLLKKGRQKDVYLMFGVEDYQHVRNKEITLFSWIQCVLKTKCFQVVNWRDPLPGIMKYLDLIGTKMRFVK